VADWAENCDSSLFEVGKDSIQSAVLKNEGLIWNSRIACLAVASHPLHQEKS